MTEASLNSFPSGQIAQKIREDPYRFLVCADKFQTGYDEPLLHTMYVDKTLSGIRPTRTSCTTCRPISTPPRSTPPSRSTTSSSATSGGADRDELDPILDVCVARYVHELDEHAQVDFKGKAKAFVRTYGFLSCVLPYTNAEWEKRSIFLNFLISKLPAPEEEDLSRGILDAIDMDSYRVEKRAVQQIMLHDEDAEIEPVPNSGGGHVREPELDRLSNILQAFNDLFGDISWDDRDRVGELITKTIPAKVAADAAFRNARENSDDANARIEHDKVLARIVTGMVNDDAELFKQFMDNPDFKRWMTTVVFEGACEATRPRLEREQPTGS